MNPPMNDPHDREAAIFHTARRLPSGERAAYLDVVCARDARLRQLVQELLQAGDEAGDFLAGPAAKGELPFSACAAMKVGSLPNPTETLGPQIGRYKLLQQIG